MIGWHFISKNRRVSIKCQIAGFVDKKKKTRVSHHKHKRVITVTYGP